MNPRRRWYAVQDRIERAIQARDDGALEAALAEARALRAEEPEWADYVDWLLYVAAEYGHTSLISALLEMGASVDNPNGEAGPAVSAAARHGRVAAVRLLVEAGAGLEVVPARREGLLPPLTPLMEAIATERVSLRRLVPRQTRAEIVRVLLDGHADPNAAVPDWTDAEELAGEPGEDERSDYRFVRRVLVAGAGERWVGFDNAITPLSLTSEPGLVRMLLEAGASPDLEPRGLPLFRAIAEGSLEAVRLLLERGAGTAGLSPRRRWSPLLEAIASDNVAIVRVLLDHDSELHGGEEVRKSQVSPAMHALLEERGVVSRA